MRKIIKLCVFLAFISCGNADIAKIQTIAVDTGGDVGVLLSEIADEIRATELELTDESLIGRVQRVLLCNDYIIVLEGAESKVILFDKTGRFIRRIGSTGQGPEELLYSICPKTHNNLLYRKIFRSSIDEYFCRQIRNFDIKCLPLC
ncbi:MAG: 6-bladed beta-propeller, partial [Prevotellaceae bacterium]|nr:6-bladed beta-propeller [Prevotellaceae bacterium]